MTDASDAGDPSEPAGVLGRVALHPILLAIHPALAVWAANVSEVELADTWSSIWVPAVIVIGAWALGWALVRSGRRAALGASAGITIGLWSGRLVGAIDGTEGTVLAVIGGALVLALASRWSRPTVLGVTAMVNVLALVLVAFTAPTVLGDLGGDVDLSEVAVDVPADGLDPGELPDIWYLIPDRYPRADTLADEFGYDNATFIAALEELGFQVAERSLANYPSTGMSLASTWNLAPVDQLIAEVPDDPKDWAPAYRLLRDHALGRNLVRAGYEYVHLGTWWNPTAKADSATTNLRADIGSDFVQAVFRGDSDPERAREPTLYQFEQLSRLAAEDRPEDAPPRFVLAHITVPHEPYVFDRDGSLVPTDVSRSRTRVDNFTRQLEYVNAELSSLVEVLLDRPREDWPLIVIQSDEGPHPEAKTSGSYDWLTDASLAEQREKLRTFSAILPPPGSDLVVPEDLTGVNTWRLLLDEVLGTDLGLLPDQVFLYSPDAIYEVVDVTAEIRG